MPGGTSIRNETGLRRIVAGTETVPGTAVTPTGRWLGMLTADKSASLIRTQELTGGYDGLVTPRREVPTFSGSYEENLTFQSFAMHNRYAIKGGGTGVTDGVGSGMVHSKSPTATDDDIDSATLEYGVDGQVWTSTGVRHNEYTVTIDTDDSDGVWKMSSNLFLRDKTQKIGDSGTLTAATTTVITDSTKAWTVNQWAGAWVFVNFGNTAVPDQIRQIQSNTATALTIYTPAFSPAPSVGATYRIEGLFTAGIAIPAYNTIPVPGTKFFLDAATGTIGTTQLLDRLVSFNITVNNARAGKRFAENTQALSVRTGRGPRIISGQVRLEFDRRDEYQQFESLTEVALRVQQDGPQISATAGDVHRARIDVARAAWDVVDMNERENNVTATFGFVAYLPTSNPITTFYSRTNLTTLP